MGDGEDRSRKERIAREENSSVASNCYKTAFESLSSHMHSSDQLSPARLNWGLLVNMLLGGRLGEDTLVRRQTRIQTRTDRRIFQYRGAHICITMPIKLGIKGL